MDHPATGDHRTRQDVDRQLDSAWRVVGVYEAGDSGRMVGFARAISDEVAFAYLADVYIVATARTRVQPLDQRLQRPVIRHTKIIPGYDLSTGSDTPRPPTS